MKTITRIFFINLAILLFSTTAMAADVGQIAIVNVTDLFNKSSYVQKANKELQKNLQKMEKQVQEQQKKVQTMASTYENTTNKSKRIELADNIKAEQVKLNTMTQDFQKKIQTEQNSGMQEFSSLVQTAVSKVANEKHITIVINSASIVYTDNKGWVDITKDVEAEMAKK